MRPLQALLIIYALLVNWSISSIKTSLSFREAGLSAYGLILIYGNSGTYIDEPTLFILQKAGA